MSTAERWHGPVTLAAPCASRWPPRRPVRTAARRAQHVGFGCQRLANATAAPARQTTAEASGAEVGRIDFGEPCAAAARNCEGRKHIAGALSAETKRVRSSRRRGDFFFFHMRSDVNSGGSVSTRWPTRTTQRSAHKARDPCRAATCPRIGPSRASHLAARRRIRCHAAIFDRGRTATRSLTGYQGIGCPDLAAAQSTTQRGHRDERSDARRPRRVAFAMQVRSPRQLG